MVFPQRYGEPDWDRPPRSGDGFAATGEIKERPLSNKSYEELRLESVQKQWAVKFVDLNNDAVSSGAHSSFVNLKNVTDVVEVVVGEKDNSARWIIHEKLIVDDSEFAKLALNGSFKEKKERRIALPEEDADIFGEYVRFLYTGCVITFSLERVVQMYTLGDRFQSTRFANACYETIAKSDDIWSATQLKYIFDNTFQEDRLRKLCTKQVGRGILDGRYSFTLSHDQEMLKDFMPELMQGVTSAVAEMKHKWNGWQSTPLQGQHFEAQASAQATSSFQPGLFGNPRPSSTTTSASPFGQTQPAQMSTASNPFGAPPSTTAPRFGQTFSFGGQAPASTEAGLFGSATRVTSGGLFGGQQPSRTGGAMFGTQSTQSPSGGLFGTPNTQATGGLFSAHRPAAGPGLFPAPGASHHTPSAQPQNPFGQAWQTSAAQPIQHQAASGITGFFGSATANSSASGGLFGSTSATSSAQPTVGGFGSAQPSTTSTPFGSFTSGNPPSTATWRSFGFGPSQPTATATSGQSPFGQVGPASNQANSSAPKFSFGNTSAPQASTGVGTSGQPADFGGFGSTSFQQSTSAFPSNAPCSFWNPAFPTQSPQVSSQPTVQVSNNGTDTDKAKPSSSNEIRVQSAANAEQNLTSGRAVLHSSDTSTQKNTDQSNKSIVATGVGAAESGQHASLFNFNSKIADSVSNDDANAGKGKHKAPEPSDNTEEVLSKGLFNMAFSNGHGTTNQPNPKRSFEQDEWDATSFKSAAENNTHSGTVQAATAEVSEGPEPKVTFVDGFGVRQAPGEGTIRNDVMRDMKDRDADAGKETVENAGTSKGEDGDALQGAKEILKGFGARII